MSTSTSTMTSTNYPYGGVSFRAPRPLRVISVEPGLIQVKDEAEEYHIKVTRIRAGGVRFHPPASQLVDIIDRLGVEAARRFS